MKRIAIAILLLVVVSAARDAEACCPLSWDYQVIGFSSDGTRMAVRVSGMGGGKSLDAVRLYSTRSGRIVEERQLSYSHEFAEDGEDYVQVVEDPPHTRRVLEWARRVAPLAARARSIKGLHVLVDGELHLTVTAFVSATRRTLRRFVEWDDEEDGREPRSVTALDVPGHDKVMAFAGDGRPLLSEPMLLSRTEAIRLERAASIDATR